MQTQILKLNQTPYDNGKTSGQFFKEVIQNNIFKYNEAIKNPEIWNKCEIVLNKLNESYPEYVEEIKGKADGAEVDFKSYWAMMCPEILDKNRHCTTVVCQDINGDFLLSHNEDDNYIDGNFCLSKISSDNNWLVTNDIYNMPFGNGFSWNSHGIIKTINYCHEDDIHEANIPGYFSCRHISDATSIEDLIKRCTDIRPASGYHVTAIDRNTKTAVSIEVYPDDIDVIYIENAYVHSNHYIHSRYNDCPRLDNGGNSIYRLMKARELFNTLELEERTIPKLKEILKYRDKLNRFEYSIFQTSIDPYITGMNFSYNTKEPDTILLDIYSSEEYLTLPYNLEFKED